MYKFRNIAFLLILSLVAGFSIPVKAQGNLLVTPRRVVFDGSRRVMELNLANTGQDTARYNISFVQYRMTEDGDFEEITEPDPGQFLLTVIYASFLVLFCWDLRSHKQSVCRSLEGNA